MTEGDELQLDWGVLVPLFVHPLKVAIIEALWQLGTPLSATDLKKSFGGEFPLANISYHLTDLAKLGVVKKMQERQVRGTTETFYFFGHLKPSSKR